MRQLRYNGELLHDARTDLVVTDARLRLEANQAGTLEFTIHPGHPLHDKLHVMDPTHEVTVEEDGEELFRGRIRKVRTCKTQEQEVECEGQLAYLNDSLLPPYGTHPSEDWDLVAPKPQNQLWAWYLHQHNKMVSQEQRFFQGLNEGSTQKVETSNTSYPSTANEMREKILDGGGLFARARTVDGHRSLDLLGESAHECSQRIEFGVNITDFADEVSCTNMVTAIIPTAAWPDGSEHEGDMTLDSMKGPFGDCTIVNGRIQNNAAVALRGIIMERRTYNGVEGVRQLAIAAKRDLEGCKDPLRTLEVSAFDLHQIDPSIRPLRLYEWVRVTAEPYGVDQKMMVMAVEMDPTGPDDAKYTLGSTVPTLAHTNAVSQRNLQLELESGIQAVEALSEEAKASAQDAQEAAGQAHELAASKRRVFLQTPWTPYEEGDLWCREDDGRKSTWKCIREREDGQFNLNDWSLSSTDDFAADQITDNLVAYGGEAIDPDQEVVLVALDATAAQIAAAEAEAEQSGAQILRVPASVLEAVKADQSSTTINPKAVSCEMGDFQSIDAQAASIANLQSEHAKITNLEVTSLTADSAVIGALQAQTAKIEDLTATQLNATVGYIEDLTSESITVGDLAATTGYIADLTADNVTAANIIADHGDFSTVKANSAKVSNLTAEQLSAATGYIADLTAGNVTASNIVADHGDFATVKADSAKVHNLTANQLSAATGYIADLTAGSVTASDVIADHATVGDLDANYAQIDGANITTATIRDAWVNNLMVQSGLIAHQGAVFTLDAIQVNAANITAGTIDVQRLVVTQTDQQGNQQKYLVHVNAAGQPTYEKLDGNIIQPHTITADHIVAGSITTQEITVENLQGTGGWINLHSGTFAYVNATTGHGIAWDGEHLSIAGNVTIGTSATSLADLASTVARAEQKANDVPIVTLSSTNGTVFKRNVGVSTTIVATIFTPGGRIADATELHRRFGNGAYLEWGWRDVVTDADHVLINSDPRIGSGGFTLTVDPDDIDTQAVITCSLNY